MVEPGEGAVLQAGSPRVMNLILCASSQSGSDETHWEIDAIHWTSGMAHRLSQTTTSLALAAPRALPHFCNLAVLSVTGGAAGALCTGSVMGALAAVTGTKVVVVCEDELALS